MNSIRLITIILVSLRRHTLPSTMIPVTKSAPQKEFKNDGIFRMMTIKMFSMTIERSPLKMFQFASGKVRCLRSLWEKLVCKIGWSKRSFMLTRCRFHLFQNSNKNNCLQKIVSFLQKCSRHYLSQFWNFLTAKLSLS